MHTLDVMSNVHVSSGAKSSAKSGVESSAKSSAKSSAIRQGKTVGKNENIIFRGERMRISSSAQYGTIRTFR